MTSSKVLSTRTCENLMVLNAELKRLSNNSPVHGGCLITRPLHTINDEDVIVFGSDGEPLRVRLIEDTLTDGSKVYNINIE
jgi:hypothetical protein